MPAWTDEELRRIDATQELRALGLPNRTAGLSQGFPVSSSASRTAVPASLAALALSPSSPPLSSSPPEKARKAPTATTTATAAAAGLGRRGRRRPAGRGGDRQQRRQRIEPHPERPPHLRTLHPQQNHAHLLQHVLQHHPNHHQRRNHLRQTEKAAKRRHRAHRRG